MKVLKGILNSTFRYIIRDLNNITVKEKGKKTIEGTLTYFLRNKLLKRKQNLKILTTPSS